jgi:hypothetical protein
MVPRINKLASKCEIWLMLSLCDGLDDRGIGVGFPKGARIVFLLTAGSSLAMRPTPTLAGVSPHDGKMIKP